MCAGPVKAHFLFWHTTCPRRVGRLRVLPHTASDARQVTLTLAYLKSYTNMSVASVTCSLGCRCDDHLVDSYTHARFSVEVRGRGNLTARRGSAQGISTFSVGQPDRWNVMAAYTYTVFLVAASLHASAGFLCVSYHPGR